jgi:hypothetical protein
MGFENYFFIPNKKITVKIGQNVTQRNLSKFVVSSLRLVSAISASIHIPHKTPMAR